MQLRKRPRVYTGRLACDGEGNLLSDNGKPVYHDLDLGAYVFVPRGGLSHNQRHQKRLVEFRATTDDDTDQLHHLAPLPEDPHREGLLFDTDADAPTVTGHTEAYV